MIKTIVIFPIEPVKPLIDAQPDRTFSDYFFIPNGPFRTKKENLGRETSIISQRKIRYTLLRFFNTAQQRQTIDISQQQTTTTKQQLTIF